MTTEGFKASIDTMSFSAKAGKVALQALATAGNMLAMWAIGKGIELAVKGIDELAHSAEHCKERVDELMTSYKTALDKANNDAKTIEDLASRYEELSKGVNRLGNNVSLTTDEYAEYNNIVNKVADIFPELIQGYTNEGNAILSLKGNVDQLRDAYKEAQQEAYKLLIASGEGSDGNDIIKNWKNISSNGDISFIAHTSEAEAKDALQHLLELAESGSVDLFKNIFSGYERRFAGDFSKISDAIDRSNWVNLTEEDLKSMIPSIRAYIQTYQAEIDSALSDIRTLGNAYLMTNEDFASLSEQSRNAASIIINSINESIASGFKNKEDVGEYVLGIVSSIKDNPEIQDALVGLFTLDASQMQPDKAKALIDQYVNYIADILGEKPVELKIRLGFEDTDKIADNYNEVMRRAAQKFSGESFIVNGGGPLYDTEHDALTEFAEKNSINTQDEIAFWNKCIEESDTREEAMEKYLASSIASSEPQTLFTQLSANEESLDKFQSSVKSAADAYTTLLSGNYSSSELLDSIQAITKAASDMGESIDWEEIGSLDELSNAIESVSESYANSVLSGAGIDTDGKFGQMLANVIQETYKSEAQLSSLNTQIDSLQSAYDSLTDIVSTYNETGYITFDQLQTLLAMEPQYLSCLVNESGQLVLNQQAMLALANQRLNDAEAQAIQQAITELGNLTLQDEKVAVEENAQAFSNAISHLSAYNDTLADTIAEASVGAAGIRELNAAISGAEAKGASNDQIDSVLDNLNTKLQLIRTGRKSLGKGLGGIMGSSSSSSSSAAKSEFSETIDFFEQRTDSLNDALSLLKTSIDNISGSFGKNNLVDAELGITEEKFNNYTDALAMYTQKANEALAKLPADIASRVKDGAVALTDFVGDGNKDVAEAVKDYESWADKVADCQQELAELKTTIRQLELEKFNNIMEDFTSQFDIRDDSKDLITKQIDLLKEAGELVGESFFTAQADQTRKQLALLEEEKGRLVNQMSSAINTGRVQKGTEEWMEMVNALSDVDGSILTCKKSIEELDNSILELHTEIFDRIQKQFSSIADEADSIIGLFDDMDVARKDNTWTKEGLTQLGLLVQQYELAQYRVSQYGKEIDNLNADYLAGKYSATEYADRLDELNRAQWDAVNSAESAKDSIMDLNEARVDIVVDGINEEIQAYRDLTDAQIEALEASRDLHEYENTIAEKTKSVTDLERQIAAMQNDTSASTVAKRKKLEEQLAEAKKDLAETEYQHSIETQEDALNKQYKDYEKERNDEIEALRASLKDMEAILAGSFDAVRNNSALIGQEIAAIAAQHGVTVSSSLISAWQSGAGAVAGYGEVLSQNTSAFIGNIIGVENEVWNLQARADDTATSLAWMFSSRADTLVGELTTSYYAEANLADMTDALRQSLVNTLERGYDISSIVSSLDSVRNAANEAANAVNRIGNIPSSSGSQGNRGYTGIGASAAAGGGSSNLSYKALHTYVGGTRSSKGNIIITDEEGTEMKLPKLSSGQYTIANEGTQVLTKAQTDNLYDWAAYNPENMIAASQLDMETLSKIWRNANIQEPVVDSKATYTPSVSVHYDSMLTINGDVNDTNHFIKQVTKIADKSADKAIQKLSEGLRH